VHLNAVGAFRPDTRELAGDLVGAASRIVVDDRDAAGSESGDLLLAVDEGALDADHEPDELGPLLLAEDRPARADGDITLFVSQGLAVQDVAAARACLARARELGLGTHVEL
jgi:ornithine cyclodeaminase/alanine dehydrogenase-like protein (mu-crystallin family)